MDHFRIATANKSQEFRRSDSSLSVINALCLARDLPWKDSYKMLLAQGKRFGLLLNEKTCWVNMLADAGYVRIRGFRKLGSWTDLSDFLLENYPHISHALVAARSRSIRAPRFCAVRRLPDPAAGFVGLDIMEEEREIESLWLHYEEAGLPKPVLQKVTVLQPGEPVPSHKGFVYYQPNPVQRIIGDCVIRAYSAVFSQSWEATLDMLAEACEYRDTHLNSVLVYQSLASEYEFDPRSRMREQGKGLTGIEFCDRMTLMCRNGERFFAHAGRNHTVGIIPVLIDGMEQYAIADSWDSSREIIGDYWVYRPVRRKKPDPPKPEAGAPFSLDPGTRLLHPAFGEGTVLQWNEKDQRVLIQFQQKKEKLLTAAWVRANCRPAACSG